MFLVRLWQYFGVTGIFSVLLWLAACGCAVAGFAKYKDKRTRFVWLALLLAVLAFYGAKENSSNVSAIDVDRTEELALARQRQQEQARRRETERRKELMFAEESVDEMRDWVEDGDEDTGEGEDDDASAAGESGVPLYQQRGPVERDAGKKVEQKEIAESIEQTKKESAPPTKALPQEDVDRAQRWDKANLFLTRWILVLLIFLAVWDYLRRFNRTFDAFLPLPLAAPWLDRFSKKKHTIQMQGVDRHRLGDYLRDFVRRGETFIYFGDEDPLPEKLLVKVGPAKGHASVRYRQFAAWLYDQPVTREEVAVAPEHEHLAEHHRLYKDFHHWVETKSPKAAARMDRVVTALARSGSVVRSPAEKIKRRWPGPVARLHRGANAAGRFFRKILTWIRGGLCWSWSQYIRGKKHAEERWPEFMDHVEVFVYNLKRLGKHFLRRLPLALALLFVLLIPGFIFMKRSSFYLAEYLLLLILAPWPILLYNLPRFRPVLPKINYDPEFSPRDREFFFETAWFNRGCGTVTDFEESSDLLDHLRRFLKARRIPTARCRRTVNVVWDFEHLPQDLDLENFLDICRQNNFRFICTRATAPAAAPGLFDEVYAPAAG